MPTCTLAESLRDVCDRVRAVGWDTCFVVNEQRIVLGRLGRTALAQADDTTVEEAMSAGPSTVRPSLDLDKAVERMHAENLTGLPVTRSDGVLPRPRRDDAERALKSSEPQPRRAKDAKARGRTLAAFGVAWGRRANARLFNQ